MNILNFWEFKHDNQNEASSMPKYEEFSRIIFFKQHAFARIALAGNRMQINEILTEISSHLWHYRKIKFVRTKNFEKFLFFVETPKWQSINCRTVQHQVKACSARHIICLALCNQASARLKQQMLRNQYLLDQHSTWTFEHFPNFAKFQNVLIFQIFDNFALKK